MSTYVISLVSSQVAVIVKDSGDAVFKPRNMVPVVSGNSVTFQHPDNINYDFTITTDDTITASGNAVSGTAVEIADELAEAIFFIPGGGSGSGVFTTDVSIDQNHADATGLTITNTTAGGYTQIYAESAESGFEQYCTDTDMTIGGWSGSAGLLIRLVAADGKLLIQNNATLSGQDTEYRTNSSSHVFMIGGSPVLTIHEGGINNYADDSAAATAGVPVTGLYRTGSALKIRVA